MTFEPLIQRVRSLLLEPRAAWPRLAAERITAASMYREHIAWLAAIPPLFAFVDRSVLGYAWWFGAAPRLPLDAGLSGMVFLYALSLAAVYLLALIVAALAPNFEAGNKRREDALKCVGYACTPGFLAGAAVIVPIVGPLLAAAGAAYSAYLLYLGLPHTMRCPPDKAFPYAAVSVGLGGLIAVLVARIAT